MGTSLARTVVEDTFRGLARKFDRVTKTIPGAESLLTAHDLATAYWSDATVHTYFYIIDNYVRDIEPHSLSRAKAYTKFQEDELKALFVIAPLDNKAIAGGVIVRWGGSKEAAEEALGYLCGGRGSYTSKAKPPRDEGRWLLYMTLISINTTDTDVIKGFFYWLLEEDKK